jgi:hypothetical protein
MLSGNVFRSTDGEVTNWHSQWHKISDSHTSDFEDVNFGWNERA